MENIAKKLLTVEHHCLDLQYAHLRFHKNSTRDSLACSIEQNGQLMPVVMVADPSSTTRWKLIDGYLRVQALQRLGKDTIEAEVWDCGASDALIMILRWASGRALEAFEEALLLKELNISHGLSHETLARRIGRDQSWVSRRISIIEFLPDNTLQALCVGKISLWVATRVLAPMARAMGTHAQGLLTYLCSNYHITREIGLFYKHYQTSNRQERSNMVNDPELFFKAKKIVDADKHADRLRDGPEGIWKYKLNLVNALLTELIELASIVLHTSQQSAEIKELMQKFNTTKVQFNVLNAKVEELLNAK